MAQQTINVGTSPNDGTGTPLRTAFQYTNSNFSELYTAVGPSGNNIVCPGSATISGDLTVDTSTLKVDSANNRVGIGIATPNRNAVVYAAASPVLQICDSTTGTTANDGLLITQAGVDAYIENAEIGAMNFRTSAVTRYQIDSTGISTWSVGGSTAMTLNATGLGVGASPSYKLHVAGANPTAAINSTTATSSSISTLLYRNFDGNSNAYSVASLAGETAGNGGYGNLIFSTGFNGSLVERMRIDLSGNVGVGVTPSYRIHAAVATGSNQNIARFQITGASNGLTIKWNNTTSKMIVNFADCPTSPTGLSSGDLWIDTTAGNTLKVA